MSGTCFGYAVHSGLRFRYLRHGYGDPLEVDEVAAPAREPVQPPLHEWRPTPAKPRLHARLHRDGDGFRLWVAGAGGGWFTIEPHRGRIGIPPAADVVRREERLWGIPALLCFLARGDLPLHAAAVDTGSGAILLAAPSTFGKTTLAAALCGAGHRLLAEDLSCIRLGDAPAVIPGPAMLRVRRDVAAGLDLGFATPVGEDAERLHLALERVAPGSCDPVPLRAIVFLQPSEDGVSLDAVPAPEGLPELFHLSFRLPGRAHSARCFKGVAELAARVPIWNLRRPLSFGALADAVAAVETL